MPAVEATLMARTVHPSTVTSPHSIEIGGRGIGLRIFVTDRSSKINFSKAKRYGLDHIKIELINQGKWNVHNFPFFS